MKLFLLRHAKSSWASYEDDHDRKLSARGLEDARTLGLHLKRQNLFFDVTLCSSAIRTKETLEIIQHNHHTGFGKINYRDDLYHASDEVTKKIIKEHDAPSILLVSHNPGISSLISYLSNIVNYDYPTCVFAGFEIKSKSLNKNIKTMYIIRPKKGEILSLLK